MMEVLYKDTAHRWSASVKKNIIRRNPEQEKEIFTCKEHKYQQLGMSSC